MIIKPKIMEEELSPRLLFIDNLRTSLIVLVVLHHVALVYSAIFPFYYVEPPFNEPLTVHVLLVFALFNQAWFMGALFLISGYFTPGSFDRKGLGFFLKDRLLRLGIPLVIFYFVLNPISSIGTWYMPAYLTGITTQLTWQDYPHLLGLGPMWFLAMLLIFDFGYAVWRRLAKKHVPEIMSKFSPLSYCRIISLTLTLVAVTYLVRIVVPQGKIVGGYPTLSYLPQYVSFFVIGTIAYRRNWLQTLSSSKGVICFAIAVIASIFLFPLAFSGQMFSLEFTEAFANFAGNGHWQSAVYALWDSTFAVGMCLGLIVLFRHFFKVGGMLGRFLSQHSYTVYVIHIPIVVFIAVAFNGIELHNLLKFGIVVVVAVPACFAVAYLVRKIPFASRIL